MHDDLDLRGFPSVTRLFPLPGVVMFPHVVLPLHIFEPRYRQMTEHALAGDQLVTIIQLAASSGDTTAGPPTLESVGCLGRVIRHERLADGRFNILLLGRKRVRLVHEIPDDCLYRRAEVEILEDIEVPPAPPDTTELLLGLIRSSGALDPQVSRVLDNSLPLAVLTDVLAHALPIAPALKQALLAETRVSHRALALTHFLQQSVQARPTGSRPSRRSSPFSLN
jgi:Lon protease-like protein